MPRQVASVVRGSVLRSRVLSLAKTCSIGLRSAVRQLGDQTGATRRAPMAAGHIGLSPGFVDEHQALGVKPALVLLPLGPPAGDVGAVLLTGV